MTIIAASTYSFNQLISAGEISQIESIALAKDLGFDGIEIVDLIHDNAQSDLDYAQSLRNELDRLAFPITNFTFGADFLNGSDHDFEREVARIKQMIDIAEVLGAKSVRHDATNGRPGDSFAQVLPTIVKGCLAITEYAATKGITTMVENHGLFSQDSTRLESLYTAVNHPNFKLLVDMGNFLCVDEDPTLAVSRLAPYAGYAHAKDFHIKSGNDSHPGEGFFQTRGGNFLRGAIIGHGNVAVAQCLRILKLAGYDGPIAIEFEGIEKNMEGLRISLANLRQYTA
ncbi:sugar phosphate isomerase/epimerase [Vagococcus sp. BWB3-3]|uniref:Sugar phosphate isomerase/epimerase n=1 Tax=Vagococcus allomyrinae TaxID=2794353 RepID=A0A940PDX6_9ENTE|nr:sugar phosphate isomerase/epimerase family protein [Vagococcus allomyrinae]MBP1043134.1 sugar phosphate isomerase/epimerase [Vagococcus allomyrinae]